MSAQNPTVLVTGANQGIGFGTCCQLAKKGYNLVLACRNEENAKKAVEIIQKENSSIVVEYVLVDLASIQSVQECIQLLIEDGHQFDVIILNAGVCRPGQARTVDGYETTFQVNYLSQYLIAQHLINNQTHPIKVITLTSYMYSLCDYMHIPKKSDKWLSMFNNTKSHIKAYSLSKFALALLSQSLNQQEGVTAASVHPGVVFTNMLTGSISKVSRIFVEKYLKNKFLSAYDAAGFVVDSIETPIPVNKLNYAGKIIDLNAKTCNAQNIQNLIEMNRQIMQKHGLDL